MRWFRFYDDALNDPKVQRLSSDLFRAWVNLLCIASKNGGEIPGEPETLAFLLHTTEQKASSLVAALVTAQLLDQDQTLHPHNWNARQYESDSSSNRVKAFRERRLKQDGNVSVTANETPPETDTESEQREEPPVAPPSKPKRKARVQRPLEQFDAHRQPDEQDLAYAAKRNTAIDPEWGKFANYCIANNITSADFHANWRTWCDNDFKWAQERAGRGRRGGSGPAVAGHTNAFIEAAFRHSRNSGLRDGGLPGEGSDSGGDEGGMAAGIVDAECTVPSDTDSPGSLPLSEPDSISPTGRDGHEGHGPSADGRVDGVSPRCGQDGPAEMGPARKMVADAGGDPRGLPEAIAHPPIIGSGDELDPLPAFLRRY